MLFGYMDDYSIATSFLHNVNTTLIFRRITHILSSKHEYSILYDLEKISELKKSIAEYEHNLQLIPNLDQAGIESYNNKQKFHV